jgi:hypothetical protein
MNALELLERPAGHRILRRLFAECFSRDLGQDTSHRWRALSLGPWILIRIPCRVSRTGYSSFSRRRVPGRLSHLDLILCHIPRSFAFGTPSYRASVPIVSSKDGHSVIPLK